MMNSILLRIVLSFVVLAIALCNHFESNCSQFAHNLPSFLDAANDILPNDFPSRCSDCPLGIALNETLDTQDGFIAGGDYTRLQHLFRKISHREGKYMDLNIAVLGGSMTYGNMDSDLEIYKRYTTDSLACRQRCEKKPSPDSMSERCSKCTFVARFEYWLKKAYPAMGVKVYNFALPGTNSQSIVNLLGPEFYRKNFDVIFIQYSDNDRNFDERDPDVVNASFERLVRTMLNLPSHPAVINIEVIPLNAKPIPDGVFQGHKDVLHYYQIPTLNYQLSAAADFSMIERHPPWPYHQLVADLLAYTWKSQSIKSCGYQVKPLIPKYKHMTEVLSEFCLNPTSLLRADYPQAIESSAVVIGENWVYGEDVPGKLGWYIDHIDGGKIDFHLLMDEEYYKTKHNAILGIGYLKSYDQMGVISVFAGSDLSRKVYINATNDNPNHRTSMVYFKRLCVPSDHPTANDPPSQHIIPVCSEQNDHDGKQLKKGFLTKEIDLHVELLSRSENTATAAERNKFKIVYVLSC